MGAVALQTLSRQETKMLTGANGFVYLASPYTDDDDGVREYRYREACRAFLRLMEMGREDGFAVYAPIVATHPLAVVNGLDGDWEYWRGQDEPFLRLCDCLVVLELEGWDRSVGVREEVRLVAGMGKRVWQMVPREDGGYVWK